MALDGIVQNGNIILDKGTTLPEGTRVKVTVEPTEMWNSMPRRQKSSANCLPN